MVWQCDRGWFGNMTMQYCTVPFITSLLMPMGEDEHGQCIGSDLLERDYQRMLDRLRHEEGRMQAATSWKKH